MSACIAAELGEGLQAARLVVAAEAIRQKTGILIAPTDVILLERFTAPARAAVARHAWDAELAAGRVLTGDQTVTLLKSVAQAT